ncbi:MAG: tRNA 2-thiouridine(34) synthase MnmA [Deltaproteobacteria bacterium]|nr:tRNA 2-thiouridine(34) synthase MnmA [Deltaproteobacteria bacterium]
MNKTVAVAMSGGVDSSLSALLLKQQGYRVIGMFMRNWEEADASGRCTSAQDYDDVSSTCAKLGIPFYAFNFAKEYREQVFARFVEEYQKGYTPNPDILCNREIKFKVFFEKALSLGADLVATGHYCQLEDGKLLKGRDPGKDQTYFLHAIDGTILDRVLFPVGGLLKSEVRSLAREFGLPTHGKKDSTGICFIGERRFQEFLSQYIQSKRGEFSMLDGTKVGTHEGTPFYTIGQRKHLGLGGPGARWYVVKKDLARNIVYVERDHDHPELYASELTADELSWLSGSAPVFPLRCMAKIRYRQEDQACFVTETSQGKLSVRFHTPQRAIAVGQSVVFYDGDVCLGGGRIC